MTAWRELDDEIARWRDDGRRPTFWWRDDDAAEATDALDRLMRLAEGLGAPLAIAAIPARLTADAVARIAAWSGAAILQHGYRHANHAEPDEAKSEFPASRALSDRAQDLVAGRERLAQLCGVRFRPVLVPPWNRLDEGTLGVLAQAGLLGISRDKPRRSPMVGGGIRQANIHVDPIDWRGARGFIGDDAAIGLLVDHLAARRSGRADPTEPTGILTHHLVQDASTWDFLGALLGRLGGSLLAPSVVFGIP